MGPGLIDEIIIHHHFVRIPFWPYHFVRYHFVCYHFVLELYKVYDIIYEKTIGLYLPSTSSFSMQCLAAPFLNNLALPVMVMMVYLW